MPTIVSHAFFGVAVGSALLPERSRAKFLILTALCTILPDFDVIGFVFRINYGSVLGHRGITHSILFAIVMGWMAAFCFRDLEISRWKLALYFALVTASHPILDMFTDGGLGVALLAPFSNERFFFPWRPVRVSPIGVGFFSDRGVTVVLSELIWIWVPAVVISAVIWLVSRRPIIGKGNRMPDDAAASLTAGEDI